MAGDFGAEHQDQWTGGFVIKHILRVFSLFESDDLITFFSIVFDGLDGGAEMPAFDGFLGAEGGFGDGFGRFEGFEFGSGVVLDGWVGRVAAADDRFYSGGVGGAEDGADVVEAADVV